MVKKRILSFLIVLVMIVALFAGCGQGVDTETTEDTADTSDTATDTSDAADDSDTAADTEEGTDEVTYESYTLAFNLFGSGAYPLEIIAKEVEMQLTALDMSVDIVDNEFTVDKMLADLQSQLAKGVDGAMLLIVADSLFESMGAACSEANVPYVLYDKSPSDEGVIETLSNDPMFVGSISNQEYLAGYSLGEQAIADGNTTAILVRAAIGDYSMDQRDLGFSDAFADGGGEILGRAICANPTEAVTKANDLLTAYPDADCMYGVGGDFAGGGLSALETRTDVNQDMMLYVTDMSPDWAQMLLDGKIAAVNGAQWVTAAIADTLLINYLDGHQILDENGKAPWFDTFQLVTLTADNAQGFIDLMAADGSPISIDEYKSLLYRYNPDVSYQTYLDFFDNYQNMFIEKLQ